ncbi:MAG: transposase [Deltaproteobacteria bacterium]|nr:transposase [Deltaproteobacteria bacterium]
MAQSKINPETPPKDLLGKAISYAMSQWTGCFDTRNRGFTRPDNNDAENVIRPFVVGRKNWLFSYEKLSPVECCF